MDTNALYLNLAVPDGGFTIDSRGVAPKQGFAVSIYPELGEVVQPGKITAILLDRFLAKHKSLLAKHGRCFGGWHNPETGEVCLDISVVVQTAESARILAVQYKQIAYFDIMAGVSVNV